jgi:hypothetical protein
LAIADLRLPIAKQQSAISAQPSAKVAQSFPPLETLRPFLTKEPQSLKRNSALPGFRSPIVTGSTFHRSFAIDNRQSKTGN